MNFLKKLIASLFALLIIGAVSFKTISLFNPEIVTGERSTSPGWQKILLSNIITDQLDDDVVNVDLQNASIINAALVSSTNLSVSNVTTTNLAVLNQFSIPVGGNALAPLGINSTSPNASLAVKGLSTMDVVNFTSSTNNSLFKILTNGYAGLNVNTPQAVFDVRDVTPTTTNGAIFKVANSAGSLSYMFVSSTATTIRGTGGIVFFELGTATDNGSSIFIHGDNAAIAADTTKALVIRGGATYFQAGGAVNRMLINSTGLIGINTTTQLGLLTVQARTTEDPFIVASSTTNIDLFRLRANGYAGFGTSTPIANLAVSSGATTTVYLDSTAAKGTCVVIKDSDGSGYTFLTANNGAGTFSTTDCR